MKNTLIQKLENAAASHRKNSREKSALDMLILNGAASTVTYTGSGRYTKQVVYTEAVCAILAGLGVKFEVKNDAPRGGKGGEYVQIISPSILKEIAKRKKAKANADKKAAEIAAQVASELKAKIDAFSDIERAKRWCEGDTGNSHTRRTRWANRANRIGCGMSHAYGSLLRDKCYQLIGSSLYQTA